MKIEIGDERAEILNELRNLRERFTDLIEERDELVYHICPAIKADYVAKVGALETKVINLQLNVHSIKHKIELVRKRTNQGKEVIIEEIEAELEAEKDVFEQEIIANNKVMLELEQILSDPFEKKSVAEVKTIYKNIVKAIHPDINPDITEDEKELFFKAVEAYENADLKKLSIIETAIVTDEESIASEKSPEILEEKCQKLRSGINDLEFEISEIKSDVPYTWKDFLADEKAVNERRSVLLKASDDLEALYKEYERELEELLNI